MSIDPPTGESIVMQQSDFNNQKFTPTKTPQPTGLGVFAAQSGPPLPSGLVQGATPSSFREAPKREWSHHENLSPVDPPPVCCTRQCRSCLRGPTGFSQPSHRPSCSLP